ncbi:MAG: beta strand repeat-containing protein [Bacteroidia bacterium]
MVKHFLTLAFLGLWALGFQNPLQAQGTDTLATWELTGLNVTTPAWGPSPLPAQNVSSSVSTPGWTRGSGVLLTAAGVATTGSPAGNAWGGNGWDAYTSLGASNLDSTIARGDFVSITFTVGTGATVGFSSIPAYTIRRSSSGPATGQWQYSVGTSGSFVDIGSAITWGTVTSGSGNPQSAIDLSGIADLQNLGGGTTVTFRIVNMGATSSGGTWYLNQGSTPGRDLTFLGTIGGGGGGPSATLTLGALASTSVCAIGGAAVPLSVTYTSTGTLSGSVDLQLSDANGSFANPTTLGSATGSSGTITTTWPSTLVAGTGYLLRLVSGTVISAPSNAVAVLTTVPEATVFTAVPSNGSVTLTWTNPTRCFDQALVVADVVAVTGQPSGNVILANPIFGSGASVGTGYAVFVGNGQSVTVTGLTNGQTYHFKVFTQSGNTWSNGVSVQSTPFNALNLPLRSIASVIGINSDGVLDSLGARVRLTGTVYGVNQYTSSTTPMGLQFVIMDASGGIMFRRAGTTFGLDTLNPNGPLVEGDSVELVGVLEQFNGLTQINCDTVLRVASGRTLVSPTVVTTLDESTENRLVRLNGLVLVGSNWPTNPVTSGVNVNVSNGTTTFVLRILPTTDIDGTPPPSGYFDLVGLGQQFDNSVPLTSGYQITPRSLSDIIAVPLVNTVANFARNDTLVSNQSGAIGMNIAILNPNPVAQVLKVKVNTSAGAAYGVTYETFPVPVNDTITLNVPANATSASFSVLLYPAVPSGRTDTLGFTMFGGSLGITAGIVNQSRIRVQTLQIPTYSIGLLRGNNVSGTVVGIPDSNGVYVKTTGIVLGNNRRVLPSPGLEFFIFDPVTNAGIGVFRSSNFTSNPYTVTEGDLIRVIGTVSHFSGLAQINVDSIVVLSSGNALPAPQVVTSMSELTESRLIQINNLTLVPSSSTSAQWPASGATGSGRTPRATNGVDTFDIRIDNDVNLFNSPAPTGTFSMIGVGSQFDNSNPHTSGYQLCPRYLQDLVQVVTYSISGTLTYNNTASTPMTNSLVRAKDSTGAIVGTDSTDATGAYSIPALPSGTYTLEGVTSKPWGGVNATDALGINRHFTGAVPLVGLRLGAADVNGSNSVNSSDALTTNRRFSGGISSFSVGNWYTDRPSVSVSGANATQDFKMLAYADVNGSYVPSTSSRTSSTLTLHEGTEQVVVRDGLVRLALRADRAMELGAISLELPLPAELEVVGMEAGSAVGYSSWGRRDGMTCYGWFAEEGLRVSENDVLLTLVIKADQMNMLEGLNWNNVSLGSLSEMVNPWGEVIPGSLRVDRAIKAVHNVQMFPNPAQNRVNWTWNSAQGAPSSLIVRDYTGRVVASILPTQGSTQASLELGQIPVGAYTVEMVWTGSNGAKHRERANLVVRP